MTWKGAAGGALIVLGVAIVAAGVGLVVVAMLTAWSAYLHAPSAGQSVDVSVTDWAKLAEALAKLPHWAIAIILGNIQVLLGLWVRNGKATLFGRTLVEIE